MQKLNFKPLFDYLDDKFGEVTHELKDIKGRISTLTNAVDTSLKQGKDNREEIITINHRLGKNDERITTIEKKLKIVYRP